MFIKPLRLTMGSGLPPETTRVCNPSIIWIALTLSKKRRTVEIHLRRAHHLERERERMVNSKRCMCSWTGPRVDRRKAGSSLSLLVSWNIHTYPFVYSIQIQRAAKLHQTHCKPARTETLPPTVRVSGTFNPIRVRENYLSVVGVIEFNIGHKERASFHQKI